MSKDEAAAIAVFDQQEALLLGMVENMPLDVVAQITYWGQCLQLNDDVRQMAAGQLMLYGLQKARVLIREKQDA